jgi:butyrate kinase
MLIREGGLNGYLGTGDLAEVERRMDQGEERAGLVFRAMAYQIAKQIGAMSCVLNGRVDAILLTGGMARSTRLCAAISERVGWIAPLKIYAGEDELRALAEGALRVLRHEDASREYVGRVVMASA